MHAAPAIAPGAAIAPGLLAVKEIGGGTAFEAWLAFDERLYAPVVAKVMRPEKVGDPSVHEGFAREVDTLGRLSHPGIVRLFAYDDGAERPYLVLENIDGPNLSSLIAKHGYLPVHQLLPLALELASCLHYLREAGVCHLDVKPSNVIMGAPAKLIDFSVAMETKDAADLRYPIGSDEYMAPEQCEPGVRGEMGHPSDVWGFGATLFRAAAGYRAFDREPRWAQLRDEPFVLPDFVPKAFGDLVYACLAPEPAARPLPHEIALALEPMLERLPQARLSGFKISL